MLERGNLPWFEFRFENESGNCQIESPRFKVGRDASNNWTINHPTVSRNHFILTFRDYKYTIQDVGSSNGLIVNGNKTMEQVLKHGDHIQVGDISLTFHI
jgi:pSer/pThr/pTyr-binding forkhead associated (FHA) protein